MPARHLVRRLAEEIRSVERAARGHEEEPHFSTGMPSLDSLLPGRGLCRGMLVEWLPATDDSDSGVSLLGLLTARAALSSSEFGVRSSEFHSAFRIPHSAFDPLVVIDRQGTFYPPAAAAWGIPLSSMILIRPRNSRDEAWALDQVLRSSTVAAVLAWPQRLDGRAFRRLQLAAESSGTIGVLIRPASTRKEPTWADVRLCTSRVDCTSRADKAHQANFRFQISDFRLGDNIPSLQSLREETPNPQEWGFCIQRLHARASAHLPDAVQVEITPEGSIRGIPPAKPSATETRPQDTAIRNLNSAI